MISAYLNREDAMARDPKPTNVSEQPGSGESYQARRPTEESQVGSPGSQPQQAQAGFSGQRDTLGRMPLFRK